MKTSPGTVGSGAIAATATVGYGLAVGVAVAVDSHLPTHVVYGVRRYPQAWVALIIAVAVFEATRRTAARATSSQWWFPILPLLLGSALTMPILAVPGTRGVARELPHFRIIIVPFTWSIITLLWLAVRGPLRTKVQSAWPPVAAALFLTLGAATWYFAMSNAASLAESPEDKLLLQNMVSLDAFAYLIFWCAGPVREMFRAADDAAVSGKTVKPVPAAGAKIRVEPPEDITIGSEVPPSVFVSYSHQDVKWLKRLQVHLKPLVRQGTLDLWDDTRIKPGAEWRREIGAALTRSRVAVLLISADFLASDFIASNELPPILDRALQGGVRIMPLILGPCLFQDHNDLSKYQPVNSPEQPLTGLEAHKAEETLLALARAIVEHIQGAQPPNSELHPTERLNSTFDK